MLVAVLVGRIKISARSYIIFLKVGANILRRRRGSIAVRERLIESAYWRRFMFPMKKGRFRDPRRILVDTSVEIVAIVMTCAAIVAVKGVKIRSSFVHFVIAT